MASDLETLAVGAGIAYAALAVYAWWLGVRLRRLESQLGSGDER